MKRIRRKFRWPWWRKVAHELEDRHVSKEEFARAIGRKPTSVRRWLRGENAPVDSGLFADVATYLGWGLEYLLDPDRGLDDAPTASVAEKAAESLPPDVARLVVACADPAVVAYLVDALDHFERWREEVARAGPSRPRGAGPKRKRTRKRNHSNT